jgi:hypothetical protein
MTGRQVPIGCIMPAVAAAAPVPSLGTHTWPCMSLSKISIRNTQLAKERVMYRKFVPFLALLTAALAGCQSAKHKAEPGPPPQAVTPGSTFTVVKDFLIPSGDDSIYFQDSGLYPEGEIQPDDPFCQFVTGAATAAGQVIPAGAFTVSNVQYDEDGVGPGGMDVSLTEIHLQAATTGTSYRMNCMLPLLSRNARFVTPAEIQGAVGGYMDLKVAP